MIVFLSLVALVLLILYFKRTSEFENFKKKSNTDSFKKDQQLAEQERKIHATEERLNELIKYEIIVDAESRAKEILSEAERRSAEILAEAVKEFEELTNAAKVGFDNANLSAKEIRVQAKEDAKALREKADEILRVATVEAGKIIEAANKRAEEIAGEAYLALKNKDGLEKAAQAMKNIIEGYGDRYLIPSYTIIDQLAEEFGHVEAGEELKKARERTRLMVANGTAAKCDYVEANRKETAINFVSDAFNGKVDSILASVKHDNYGTLEQKIKDSYYLVNNLGKAFRNAMITPEFLASRIEELKWASIAHQLKLQEREEQRVIKEQIREEEKARREFERAIKEAQREEELLKKAIEKAQKEIGLASDEQKAKYEEKLRELNERLLLAEEKNQRAISMAQQTKMGHVYIISNIGSFGEDVYKIGMTRRLEPLDRVRELGDASVPFEFDVHAFIYSEDAPSLERELHKTFLKLQMNKVNPRKEFFRVSLAQIRAEVELLGHTPKWTMTAEAKQYRESLVIEEAIKSNSFEQMDWMRDQLEKVTEDLDEQEVV